MPRVLEANPSKDDRELSSLYLPEKISLLGRNSTKLANHSDYSKFCELMQNLGSQQQKQYSTLQQFSQHIENQSLSQGMSFFSAKNAIFMEYLTLLKVYQLYKLNCQDLTSGSGLELYKRLAYLKTLLMKLGPVEKKLEYQKNKVLKKADKAEIIPQPTRPSASEEQSMQGKIPGNNSQLDQQVSEENIDLESDAQENQLSFKPRPAALLNLKKQKDDKMKSNGKYVAPKISSNMSKEEKIKESLLKKKERHRLSIIQKLHSDLIDTDNAEQKYLGDQVSAKLKKRFEEKTRYEQENFTRIPETKKDKYYRKQMMRNSQSKNQLEEDLKEVQMVRQLFDQENQMAQSIKAQNNHDARPTKKFSKKGCFKGKMIHKRKK